MSDPELPSPPAVDSPATPSLKKGSGCLAMLGVAEGVGEGIGACFEAISCLESAAIDRIFYNLANNARRHAADGFMEMVVFEVPEAPGECLRFVLSNAVAPEQARALRRIPSAGNETNGTNDSSSAALRLDGLFMPSVSTTGSGLGLAIVAEFTAHAFGLKNARQAVQQGYVGAVLESPATFRTWFHWPMARRGLEPKLDDYRRPAQSLSDG